MAAGMPSVIATSTGATALGRMWRKTTRSAPAPTDSDQTTNSRSRSVRNSARTNRVTPIHPVSPITDMMVQMEGRRTASTARSRKKRGKTSIRSTTRMTTPSTMPPRYPAAAPSSTPQSASWLREKVRQNRRTSPRVRGPGGTLAPPPAAAQTNARVHQSVRDVGEEVGDQGECGHDDEVAHDERVVPGIDALDHELPHTGDGEDGFDDHAAADEPRQGQPQDGDHGEERVAEGVLADDGLL